MNPVNPLETLKADACSSEEYDGSCQAIDASMQALYSQVTQAKDPKKLSALNIQSRTYFQLACRWCDQLVSASGRMSSAAPNPEYQGRLQKTRQMISTWRATEKQLHQENIAFKPCREPMRHHGDVERAREGQLSDLGAAPKPAPPGVVGPKIPKMGNISEDEDD